MIKKNQRYFNWINRLLDMGIIYICYVLAVVLWLFVIEKNPENIAVYYAFVEPLPVLVLSFLFIVIFQSNGLYDSFRSRTLTAELTQLIWPFIVCMGLFVGCIFIFRIREFSRGVMVSFAVLSYLGLCVKRIAMRLVLRIMRKKGYNKKYVLLIGNGKLAEKYVQNTEDNPRYGFQCIGYVANDINIRLGRYFGSFEHLSEIIDELNPDEIVIALQHDEMDIMNSIILACEEQGIRASIIPAYNDYLPDCASIDVLGGVKLINIRAISQDISVNRAAKRVMDIVLSSFALLITSPILLVVAIGVKLSGPGDILFKQVRVGRDREEFVMYKFRSMVPNKDSDTAWSKARDNRVTPLGAFIRKFSIDELPQFLNVLKGDMSIVGPRPELPYFVNQYKYSIPRYMVKHQVKPGLTGWAQVNGYRGDTSIAKRIEHDIWYIENWSLLLDIKIMLMTAFGGMMNSEKNLAKEKEEERV